MCSKNYNTYAISLSTFYNTLPPNLVKGYILKVDKIKMRKNRYKNT